MNSPDNCFDKHRLRAPSELHPLQLADEVAQRKRGFDRTLLAAAAFG
jgi:hypothetical protein